MYEGNPGEIDVGSSYRESTVTWRFCACSKNREIKIHVYPKRQTLICTTWPSFPLVFRWLFIASTQKISSFMPVLTIGIVRDCFYLLFSILRNSQLYVSVKSKLQHAPPGHLTFLKIIVQIPPYRGQNAVQMPHTRVHSGDQMPPPRGHFTGTKMTEAQWKRLQLSNKIFINITKTEKHC